MQLDHAAFSFQAVISDGSAALQVLFSTPVVTEMMGVDPLAYAALPKEGKAQARASLMNVILRKEAIFLLDCSKQGSAIPEIRSHRSLSVSDAHTQAGVLAAFMADRLDALPPNPFPV